MRTEIITIETEQDLAEARALVASLGRAEKPEDVARLRAQALVLQAYEARRWPVAKATPADILAYIMDQFDLQAGDLREILGGGAHARVSEILAGKKGFSLPQIRRMHQAYGIPADLLITEPERNIA